MTARSPRGSLIPGLTLLLATLTLSPTQANGSAQPESSIPDCGTVALYNLLRLKGIDVNVPQIEAHLPAPTAAGRSMRDLRDAARELGLKLSAISLKEAGAIDRPMLAFLKDGARGHFVVIRPVGHTGRLAQVIDLDQPPRVVDKSALFSDRTWTGFALVPGRLNALPLALSGLIGTFAVILLIMSLTSRFREIPSARQSS